MAPRRRITWGAAIGGYWIVQAVAIHLLHMVWVGLVPEQSGEFFANPFRAEVWESVLEPELLVWSGVVAGVITLAQGLFILPVRRPGLIGRGGRSVRCTLIGAGLAIGLLTLGTVLGLMSALELIVGDIELIEATFHRPIRNTPGGGWTWIIGSIAVAWVIPTVLLFVFVRRGRREDLVSRLANRVLIGTAAEICLLIPLDLMVRRKTGCYCAEGTFMALTLAGWAGVIGAGPAVFMPLIAKRRKRWYAGHCAACGYDMSATMDADRCPECGVGWRGSGEGTQTR